MFLGGWAYAMVGREVNARYLKEVHVPYLSEVCAQYLAEVGILTWEGKVYRIWEVFVPNLCCTLSLLHIRMVGVRSTTYLCERGVLYLGEVGGGGVGVAPGTWGCTVHCDVQSQ
jgi:hypothetical protein